MVGVVVAALVAMQTYVKRGLQEPGIMTVFNFYQQETNITAGDRITYLGDTKQYNLLSFLVMKRLR